MAWTSYLSDSPARLSTVEWWLYLGVVFFAVLGALCALMARQVGAYRTSLEMRAVASELANARDELLRAREELGTKGRTIKQLAPEARPKAEDVQARQAPRRLTSAQATQIIRLLSDQPRAPIRIVAGLGDDEAIQYANDLVFVFKAAGWAAHGVHQQLYTASRPIGLLLFVNDRQSLPLAAALLVESLGKAGLQIPTLQDSSLAPGGVELVVGKRPQ